jgi:hypothetical protein
MVTSPKGLRPEEDCAGKSQQHMQKTDPSSCQKGRLTKQNRNCQIVINIWTWALDGARHWLAGRQLQCDFDLNKCIACCGILAGGQRCERRSWRISIVRIRCQETKSESRLKRPNLCSSDSWIVKISNNAIITCSYDWPLNRVTNPNPVYSHSYTWQYTQGLCQSRLGAAVYALSYAAHVTTAT